MTDKTDSKERDLMALVDAYAEARHIGGCHTYNAKTADARNAVIAKLAANAGSEPVAGIGSAAGDDAEFGQRAIYPLVDIDHLEYGTKLYTHPSPPEGMVGGWMPIETAPKDGRTVLLGYFNSASKWRTTRGQWMDQDYINEYAEEPERMSPG